MSVRFSSTKLRFTAPFAISTIVYFGLMERLDEHTIDSGFLPISHGHEMFYEVWGKEEAPTILFFHGGPGYGYTAADKTLFDPDKCNVIFFDQRGSGRSRFIDPFEGNTTDNLLKDVEVLRDRLGIKRAILVGGSWGTTLALLHAMNYPHLTTAVVLRAFFPGNRACIHAMTDQSNVSIVPDAYLKFVNKVPRNERSDMIAFYARALRSVPPTRRLSYAESWHRLGAELGRIPDPPAINERSILHAAITAHYAYHNCFLPDNYLYNKADRLEGIPIEIVHGTEDLLCPITFARDLTELQSDINLVEVRAGHSAFEPNMFSAVRNAIDRAIALAMNED